MPIVTQDDVGMVGGKGSHQIAESPSVHRIEGLLASQFPKYIKLNN
jgi:hypothetical protein